MSQPDPHFARLVSLACHDLRTPLATVHGFARTLTRMEDLSDSATRYLGMIETASVQLTELLDDLGLAARIAAARWEPNLQDVELLHLVAAAAEDLGAEGRVDVTGRGGLVRVDADAARRAIYSFARCALRHGGLERIAIAANGGELRLSPVDEQVAPIIVGRDLRDLGAAVSVRVVEALGGSARVERDALRVQLPAGSG